MKKKKILITGGAGFIGSEFVRFLSEKQYKLIIVDKLTYAGDLKRIRMLANKIKVAKIDICNQNKLFDIFEKEKPDIVVNFAAETHVDRSILSSRPFILSNVLGTQNLLDAARMHDVKRFVHISTDEVYGDIEKGQFCEHFPFNPSSPYSASKAAADHLVQSYVRTFQMPCVIVRPSNNYGPWQYPEKFIPVIIYKALKNKKIPVFAKGLNIREWLYVSDCVQAIYTVMRKGRIGEAYNIGSSFEKKNIEVVRSVLDVLGKPHRLIKFVKDRPGHDYRYSLNISKIRKEIGWKPKINFETGIKKTIEWYIANYKWLEQKSKTLEKYWHKVYG